MTCIMLIIMLHFEQSSANRSYHKDDPLSRGHYRSLCSLFSLDSRITDAL